MKKIVKFTAALLLPAMLLSLSACSGTETASSDSASSSVVEAVASAPSEITAKIQGNIEMPSMAEITEERMTSYYEIDPAKLDSFSAYICGSGAYPDEIAVFKMKSSDDTSAVKEMLEVRVAEITKTFENYTPDEMYKIDGSNVVVKGNYVALIITADNASAKSTFESMAG